MSILKCSFFLAYSQIESLYLEVASFLGPRARMGGFWSQIEKNKKKLKLFGAVPINYKRADKVGTKSGRNRDNKHKGGMYGAIQIT